MKHRQLLLVGMWHENRLLISLFVLMLLFWIGLTAGHRLVLEPQLRQLHHEQLQLQRQVALQQDHQVAAVAPVSQARELRETLDWYYDLIPFEADLPNFLGELFQWAQQTRLDIDRINYQAALDEKRGFLRYDLGFSLNGDYARIKEFIHLLEASQRVLLIERIALSSTSMGQKNRDVVDLRIDLGTFFRRDSR
jgi:Tfp pilus assembly protein PilO